MLDSSPLHGAKLSAPQFLRCLFWFPCSTAPSMSGSQAQPARGCLEILSSFSLALLKAFCRVRAPRGLRDLGSSLSDPLRPRLLFIRHQYTLFCARHLAHWPCQGPAVIPVHREVVGSLSQDSGVISAPQQLLGSFCSQCLLNLLLIYFDK